MNSYTIRYDDVANVFVASCQATRSKSQGRTPSEALEAVIDAVDLKAGQDKPVVIGTCSHCGGPVQARPCGPAIRIGSDARQDPTPPWCGRCGRTAAGNFGPMIEMVGE